MAEKTNKQNVEVMTAESKSPNEIMSELSTVAQSGLEVGKKSVHEGEQSQLTDKSANDTTPAETFSGLPLGMLIAQPFIEASKGQQALVDVYLDTVEKLAFKQNDKGEVTQEPRLMNFKLQRPVKRQDGTVSVQSFAVNAPVMSLVPVPSFLLDDMSVNFSMEVKTQSIEKNEEKQDAGVEAGYKGWGFSAKVTGEVSSSSARQRSNDTSAKYEISARASQQEPTEGMNRLTSLFASMIEPIETSSGSKS